MEQFRRYGGEQCRHQLIELPESLAQPVTFTDNVITDGHSASRTATGGTARLRVCGTGRPLARTLGRDLRRAIPDVYRGYAALHEAALTPGALDTKTKELLALAIAVTRKCGGCIAAHAQGAAHNDARSRGRRGARGGDADERGPATVYGRWGFAAFREFSTAEPVAR